MRQRRSRAESATEQSPGLKKSDPQSESPPANIENQRLRIVWRWLKEKDTNAEIGQLQGRHRLGIILLRKPV
jgi:hypothetical protein